MQKMLMLVGLALATPVIAKKPKIELPTPPTISASPISQMIAAFDSDGNARVTRAEFDAGVARSFADGDENKDGRITLIELSRWSTKWLGNAGALPGQYDFDRDSDDAISLDEYRAEFAKRFTVFDKDKDGVLSRSELISLFPQPPIPLRPGQGAPPQPEDVKRN